MKGIFLTEEGKKEIENQISELERQIKISESLDDTIRAGIETFEKRVYEEILTSATILPVEESWNILFHTVDGADIKNYYPNGVIIKPKQ
jgi:hypothetical protein